MSDSVQPHRRQPTRLPHPWDSPGKNTVVGCYFLLQCMKVKSESEVAQSCRLLATPWTAAYQAPPSMGFSRQEYWSGVPLPSPIPFFKSTIFPAALVIDSSEYLVLPETLWPKQLHHTHTWPSQGQTQVLQGSLRKNPCGQTTCRGGNKITNETQGQCG